MSPSFIIITIIMQISQPQHFPLLHNLKHCRNGNKASHYHPIFSSSQTNSDLDSNFNPFVCSSHKCSCRPSPPELDLTLSRPSKHTAPSFSPTLHSLTDFIRKANHQIQNIDINYYNFQYNRLVKALDILIETVELRRDELKERMEQRDMSLYLEEEEMEMWESLRDEGEESNRFFREIKREGVIRKQRGREQRNYRLKVEVNGFMSFKNQFEEILRVVINNSSQEIKKVVVEQQLITTFDKSQQKQPITSKYQLLQSKYNELSQKQFLLQNQPFIPTPTSNSTSISSYFTSLEISSQHVDQLNVFDSLPFPNLQYLFLKVTADNILKLHSYPNIFENLKELYLTLNTLQVQLLIQQFQKITENGGCKGLEKLRVLWRWYQWKEKIPRFFKIFKGVKEINLDIDELEGCLVDRLLDNENLEVLALKGNHISRTLSVNRDQEEHPDISEPRNSVFQNIRILLIERFVLDLNIYENIFFKLLRIQELNLSRTFVGTDAAIFIAKYFDSLKRLRLDECGLRDQTICFISNGAFGLRALSVGGNQISDNGFQMIIRNQRALESLDMGSQKPSYQTNYPPITVSSLLNLSKKLPKLQNFYIELGDYENLSFLYDLLKIKYINIHLEETKFEIVQDVRNNFAHSLNERRANAGYLTNMVLLKYIPLPQMRGCLKLEIWKLINNSGCEERMKKRIRDVAKKRGLESEKEMRNLEMLMEIRGRKKIKQEFYE